MGACDSSGEPPASGGQPPASATPSPPAATSGALALQRVFGEQKFVKPVGLETRSDKPDLVYIFEQPGRIVSMSLSEPTAKPITVLDITDRVTDDGNEQGLLGLAFNPKVPGQAFVNYTTKTHTVIARYDAAAGNPQVLDKASEKVILTFSQPYTNHNGGQLAFGPDGYLYIATGDGGSGGDPQNNGQNLNSLLGKILRIDVNRTNGTKLYAIPADNPFATSGAPEIYAYGLRNPWRFSFDPPTGELWAADVGQNKFEEINKVKAGKNYGWKIQEGFECYSPATGCSKAGLEQPIFAYGRTEGVSVTGGYVYRGSAIPDLQGWYIYGDYGSGKLWALKQQANGTADNKLLMETDTHITSFGLDSKGELYMCTYDGEVLKLVRQSQTNP
jgi:glucose/arabinose dehydrogenase